MKSTVFAIELCKCYEASYCCSYIRSSSLVESHSELFLLVERTA